MNKLDQKAILCYLRNQRDFLESQYGVTKIALFGSFARNEARADSDVDLLIECKLRSFSNRNSLRQHLEKEFGRKVDVTYFGSVRSFYRRYIDKDLIYA